MKVLIIEDEYKIASVIQKGLEQEHITVDTAYSGISGFDLAMGEEYDVIVVDWMIPGMTGIELCQALRKAQKYTPILMLTAKTQTANIVEGLNAGADDYLAKPFAFDELLARIFALSRRPATSNQPILTVNNLVLDPFTYTVKRGETELTLSSKEFSLLEYLMRHPKQIFSKEHLISHVWNFDSTILPNTIEVYIRNLRTKIDLPFPKQPALIQTVRGFGYKLG